MPHAALDLKFHSDPKVLNAGLAATGLYSMSLSYCADHLTDGHVPRAWAKAQGKPSVVKKLLDIGLWVETEDGYRVPNFLQHNFSKADVEAKREAGREAADKRWRPRKSMPEAMGDPLSDPMLIPLSLTHTPKSKDLAKEEGIGKNSLGIGEGAANGSANGNGNAEVSEETRHTIRERFQLPPRA